MAGSKFRRRSVKSEANADTPEILNNATDDSQDLGLDRTAYDIITTDGGRSYQIISISYNPATKDAIVSEIKAVTRQVGLQHNNQKRALETLAKLK